MPVYAHANKRHSSFTHFFSLFTLIFSLQKRIIDDFVLFMAVKWLSVFTKKVSLHLHYLALAAFFQQRSSCCKKKCLTSSRSLLLMMSNRFASFTQEIVMVVWSWRGKMSKKIIWREMRKLEKFLTFISTVIRLWMSFKSKAPPNRRVYV